MKRENRPPAPPSEPSEPTLEGGSAEKPGASHCRATTSGGKPCSAPPLDGQEYCWFHSVDPETVRRRDNVRSLAGSRTARRSEELGRKAPPPEILEGIPEKISTAGELIDVVGLLLSRCAKGEVDVKLAPALAGVLARFFPEAPPAIGGNAGELAALGMCELVGLVDAAWYAPEHVTTASQYLAWATTTLGALPKDLSEMAIWEQSIERYRKATAIPLPVSPEEIELQKTVGFAE